MDSEHWRDEYNFSLNQVEDILSSTFQNINILSLERLGCGWDFNTFIVNEKYTVGGKI